MVLGVVVSVQLLPEPRAGGTVDWTGIGAAWGLALAAKYQAVLPVAAVGVAALVVRGRERLRLLMAGAVGARGILVLVDTQRRGRPATRCSRSCGACSGARGGRFRTTSATRRWCARGSGGTLQAALARLVMPPDGLGWWFLLAVPLALAALLRRGEPEVRVRLVGGAVVIATAAWLFSSQTTRYALPVAALMAALAVAGAAGLGRWPARVAACALSLALAHGVLTLGVFLTGTLRLGELRAGTLTAEAWREGLTVDDPLPAYRACGRLLPADARVLVVGEGRSWGCPRPHHVSAPYDTQLAQEMVESAADAGSVASHVRAAGFTHLLISWSELERLGGPDYRVMRFEDPRAAERWRWFLVGCTSPLWREGSLEIRALRTGCTSAPGRGGEVPAR